MGIAYCRVAALSELCLVTEAVIQEGFKVIGVFLQFAFQSALQSASCVVTSRFPRSGIRNRVEFDLHGFKIRGSQAGCPYVRELVRLVCLAVNEFAIFFMDALESRSRVWRHIFNFRCHNKVRRLKDYVFIEVVEELMSTGRNPSCCDWQRMTHQPRSCAGCGPSAAFPWNAWQSCLRCISTAILVYGVLVLTSTCCL